MFAGELLRFTCAVCIYFDVSVYVNKIANAITPPLVYPENMIRHDQLNANGLGKHEE